MAIDIKILNKEEKEYEVNGKGIKYGNIPYYKKMQTHFTMCELLALENYLKSI